MFKKPILWIALVALTGACGPGREDGPARPSGSGERKPLRGTLMADVAWIESNSSLESCDLALSSVRKELARALDQRASALVEFATRGSAGSGEEASSNAGIPFGPLVVEDRPPEYEPGEDWVYWTNGWTRAYRDYLAIKDDPVSEDWLVLNREVRSLLVNDQMRLDGRNMYLTPHSEAPLREAIETIAPCLADAACSTVTFSDTVYEFLSDIPYYSRPLYAYERLSDPSDRRGRLNALIGELRLDYRRAFEIRRNAGITREGSVLHVPLFPGPFAADRAVFERAVAALWTGESLSARPKWVESPGEGIFALVAGTNLGERSYVSHTDREMVLFPGADFRVMAHEFGHVLGLRDRYYTVWNRYDCTYTDWINERDLMSDHTLGSVTAEDWATLDRTYPAP